MCILKKTIVILVSYKNNFISLVKAVGLKLRNKLKRSKGCEEEYKML